MAANRVAMASNKRQAACGESGTRFQRPNSIPISAAEEVPVEAYAAPSRSAAVRITSASHDRESTTRLKLSVIMKTTNDQEEHSQEYRCITSNLKAETMSSHKILDKFPVFGRYQPKWHTFSCENSGEDVTILSSPAQAPAPHPHIVLTLRHDAAADAV